MYDQGSEFNWAQVMGKNKALWLIPYIGKAGYPNGDGVVFPSRGSDRDSSIMDYNKNLDNLSDADKQNPLEKYLDKPGAGGAQPTDNFTPYQQRNGYGGTVNPLMNTGNYGDIEKGRSGPTFETARSNGMLGYGAPTGLGGLSGGFSTGFGGPAPQNGAAYNTLSPFQVTRNGQGQGQGQGQSQGHAPPGESKTSPLLYHYS